MTRFTRRTGTRCLRCLFVSAAFFVAGPANAQDVLKPDQRNKLDDFRAGRAPFSPEIKEICDKAAAGYVARLSDSKFQQSGADRGMSWWVHDLAQRFSLPDHGTVAATTNYASHPERKPFVEEFGKSLVAALQAPAMSAGNPIVQINANRMIAEVCRAGYDGAAEVCLKVLAKPDPKEDAAKFYALQGLKNLFAIVPEKDAPPEKTVFQKDNTGQLSPLEIRCIKALTDFVFRTPPPDLQPSQIDALFYVRREAVRALALVRVQQVRDKRTVVGQPALALLKIARGDGLNPPSATQQGPDMRGIAERLEAIIGFCNLVPPRSDRDMNVDYAAYHIGRALQEIAPVYRANSRDTSIPWRLQAMFVRDALQTWAKRSAEVKGIENYKLVQDLFDIVDRDILKAIEEGKEESRPDVQNLDQWLKANTPKSTSLFKNAPTATVNVP
jgi:hypothetical protein